MKNLPWSFWAAVALLVPACMPARYPSLPELAILLANTTDKAVSNYILETPETAMPVTADFLLEADERMIEIARLGGNACLVVKDARTIAKAIKCTECTKIAEQIEAVAKCPL